MLQGINANIVNEATAEVAREGSEIAARAEPITGIHSHSPVHNERGEESVHSLAPGAPAAHNIMAPHSSTGTGRIRSNGLTISDSEAERARVQHAARAREEAERALVSALSQAAGRDPEAERALEEAIMQAAKKYPVLNRALEKAGPEEDPVVAREQAARLDAAIAQVARVEPALALALRRVRVSEGDISVDRPRDYQGDLAQAREQAEEEASTTGLIIVFGVMAGTGLLGIAVAITRLVVH